MTRLSDMIQSRADIPQNTQHLHHPWTICVMSCSTRSGSAQRRDRWIRIDSFRPIPPTEGAAEPTS